MIDALGFMLPAAFAAIAMSLPAIVVAILLVQPDADPANSAGYVCGWLLSFAITGAVFLVTAEALSSGDSDEQSTWVSVLLLTIGVALVAFALRKVRNRPRADQPPKQSALVKAVDGLTPARAALLGAMMGGFNPKFLAVIGSLTAELTLTDASSLEQALVMVVFTLIASVGVLSPIVAVRIGGDGAQVRLGRVRDVLDRYTWLIMMLIFGYFGVKLIGDALRALV